MKEISRQLEAVRGRIAAAAERAGRKPEEITLVAVSKTHPPEAVREALEAGQTVFGESRAQEFQAKAPLLPAAVRWHFIGHLQKNKIRKVLPLCECLHGVDSADLAGDMDRIAAELGQFPRVLLEVNVSGEGTKFGFAPEKLKAEIESLLSLPRLQVEGLMTIAPYAEDPQASRPHFRVLRQLRDELSAAAGVPLPALSMGMSGDYETAIEEGATLVRVGTAIFGTRGKL